jgi:1,4-alpha-glucan branching enzyme
MIALTKKFQLLDNSGPHLLYEHPDNMVIIFKRSGLLFAFNFHPVKSYSDYRFEAPSGKYQMILNSDAPEYGGHNRLAGDQEHKTSFDIVANRQSHLLSLYLPTRTALILRRLS